MSAYREAGGGGAGGERGWPMSAARMTTLDRLDGRAPKQTLGVVRGIGRMRDAGLRLGQSIEQRVDGGYHEAHDGAVAEMMGEALRLGANAIVGVRFELGAWADGVPVCLAYGTAVEVDEA